MFPTRSSSLRLFTLKSLQNIGETIMFASSRPCSTTFYKKSHFWYIFFDQILPLAMFGNIQGGPSLRVFMNVKVINTYCKISTCATSWNHAQHIFYKNFIFQLLSSVVSKGWSIRMLLPNQSKHMPNHYSLQLCGPPNFHKICNFLCTQITTLTSTLQSDAQFWVHTVWWKVRICMLTKLFKP